MKIDIKLLFLALFIVTSCNTKNNEKEVSETTLEYNNKGHKLVAQLVEKVGSYKDLLKKNDVIYTYTYTTPDGKADVSTEKYLFDGELSYGKYEKHERTLTNLAGTIEQGFDGEEYWLKNKGKIIKDSIALNRVKFNRPTNFYWFTMFQKLLDPNLIYEYLGEQIIDKTSYDIVKISFESKDDKPTDIYQIFINKETQLVDQFLFTVADFGVIQEPYIMQMEYEKVDGMLIPTKRKYKKSTWDAEITQNPWITVDWTNISFNNGLTKSDFKK
jgi:hypothetical protein